MNTRSCRTMQNSRSSPLQGRGFSGAQQPMHLPKNSPSNRPVNPGAVGMMRILGDPPANSSCQFYISVVQYPSGTSLGAFPTPLRPHPAPKKSCEIARFLCNVSPLNATLMDLFASVANKRLTELLSSLDATLTKNIGGGGTPFGSLHLLARHRKSAPEE
jgi:hypothetical protein